MCGNRVTKRQPHANEQAKHSSSCFHGRDVRPQKELRNSVDRSSQRIVSLSGNNVNLHTRSVVHRHVFPCRDVRTEKEFRGPVVTRHKLPVDVLDVARYALRTTRRRQLSSTLKRRGDAPSRLSLPRRQTTERKQSSQTVGCSSHQRRGNEVQSSQTNGCSSRKEYSL